MFGLVELLNLALCVSFLIVVIYFKGIINRLEDRLNESTRKILGKEVELPNLNELKDEVLDVVHDTLQNLQPPSAIDHLMGAASQYFQLKMMKDFNLNDVKELAVDTVSNVFHPDENV